MSIEAFILQPVDMQGRNTQHMVTLGTAGIVFKGGAKYGSVGNVSRLGQAKIQVNNRCASGHDDAKLELRSRLAPAQAGLCPLLRPQQTDGHLGALREAQDAGPGTGSGILVHGGETRVHDVLCAGCGWQLRLLAVPRLPAVKGGEVAKEGHDVLVRVGWVRRIHEDEAECVGELGGDGAALESEGLTVDAAAVEAQNAWEGEVVVDGHGVAGWLGRCIKYMELRKKRKKRKKGKTKMMMTGYQGSLLPRSRCVVGGGQPDLTQYFDIQSGRPKACQSLVHARCADMSNKHDDLPNFKCKLRTWRRGCPYRRELFDADALFDIKFRLIESPDTPCPYLTKG